MLTLKNGMTILIFIYIINFVNYHKSTDILSIIFFIVQLWNNGSDWELFIQEKVVWRVNHFFFSSNIGKTHCLSIIKSIWNNTVKLKSNENE